MGGFGSKVHGYCIPDPTVHGLKFLGSPSPGDCE